LIAKRQTSANPKIEDRNPAHFLKVEFGQHSTFSVFICFFLFNLLVFIYLFVYLFRFLFVSLTFVNLRRSERKSGATRADESVSRYVEPMNSIQYDLKTASVETLLT
jgi:hypothetical protein